jgi:D-3-phosphoglycerate dehydrogenase
MRPSAARRVVQLAAENVRGKRILVTEDLHEQGIKMLEDAGMDLVYWDWQRLTDPDLPTDVDAIIGKQYFQCNAQLMDRLSPQLKWVITCGAGKNNIDEGYCADKGIKVFNAPGSNAVSVAEQAIMMMIGGLRYINECQSSLRNGEWLRDELAGNELMGKTVGIIGLGAIGKALAKRLSAFELDIIYHDIVRYHDFEAEWDVTFVSHDELLARADIVTIHVWLDEKTQDMANAEFFNKMKDGAMFFNLARGPMVVIEDLKTALRSGKLRYAGLDTYPNEPNDDMDLMSIPNLIVTPHTSGIPHEGYIRMNTWAVQWFLNEA